MFNKNILSVTLGLVLLLPASASAGDLLSLDKGAAKTINVKRNIDTVFVADTQIADYKVIANGKLVIYGIGTWCHFHYRLRPSRKRNLQRRSGRK